MPRWTCAIRSGRDRGLSGIGNFLADPAHLDYMAAALAALAAGVIYQWRAQPGAASTLALRSEEHTSELQSHSDLVCRLLLEKKNNKVKPDVLEQRCEKHRAGIE